MSIWAMVAYGCAGLLALLILFLKGPSKWIWHLLSVLVAVGIGLIPIPPKLNTPQASMVIGSLFIFLFVWGAAAPLFLKRKRRA